MIAPIDKLAFMFAVMTLPTSAVRGQQHTPAKDKSAAAASVLGDKRLIGAWQPRGGGKPIVYLPHGQGRNPEGSRFTWHREGDYLVVRALSAEGKPAGDVARIPLLFTRDGKEYATFLEGGKRKTPFYHLLSNGKVDVHRTRTGGEYPPNKFLPKEEEEDAPAKATQKPVETPPKQPDMPRTTQVAPGKGRLAQGIYVGQNVHVSVAWPHTSHAEVTMAADPVHAEWLLAASMFSPPPVDAAAPKVIVYASRDRGKTWQVSLTRKNPNPQTYADPAFAYGPEGDLYFVNMYWPSLDAAQGLALQFTRTRDGGRTWSAMTQISGLHDRPFLAVDTSGGRCSGWLYCTDGFPDKGVFVSKDQAATFVPIRGWSKRPNEAVQMGNPVVTSEGSLVLLYTTVAGQVGTTTSGGKRARRVDPDEMPKQISPVQPITTRSVAIVRSLDSGVSFEEAQQVAEYRDGPGRGGLPMLAIDTSTGTSKDRLYAVWVDKPARGSRVMVASSQDGGRTWSPSALLSEQAGEDGTAQRALGRATNPSRTYEAFLPSVAVNKEGVVGVSWYDTRGLPSMQPGWNLRFRASRDGGHTWLPSVQVTNVSTLFKERKHRGRDAFIQPGHTAGLAADASGVFHPLWIDRRTGTLQVFTADVIVAGTP